MEESEAEQDWVADQTHASAPVSDAELISSIETIGINATARKYGIGARSVHHRRRNLELKYKRRITVPGHPNLTQPTFVEAPHRLELDVQDGTVLVGSDGHYWPGPATTAHRAFVQFIKELKPKIVFMNGDAFDGARISRHPTRPMVDQERAPEVIEELEAARANARNRKGDPAILAVDLAARESRRAFFVLAADKGSRIRARSRLPPERPF